MADVTDLTARRLDALLAVEQRVGRIPSVAVAVVRDGSVVWRGSRGVATGSPNVPPTDLQYRIGSITKTMTAMLLMQQRNDGRVSLNDAVSTYLPEIAPGHLTLRSLLSHSSGLAAEPTGEWWERSKGVEFEVLAAGLGDGAPPLEPGATYHYSNVAFALLGEVVARVAERPWRSCLFERLLEPLGMRRTGYDPAEPHARGYSVAPYAPVLTPEPATDTVAMAPAGQLWSTVLDLARYADFLVAGRLDVLPLETLEEMSTPQSGTLADGLGNGYGLGLRLLPGGSGMLVGHTGSMPGFQAALFVDRPRRTGVAVLANSTTGLHPDRIATELLEELERNEPTLGPVWQPAASVPAPVEEVLGVWHWGNTAHIATWDGARLHLAPAVTRERDSTFRLSDRGLVGASGYHHGEPLEVVRRPNGSVSHLVCSTFVLTRTPYDPAAPIPGGAPTPTTAQPRPTTAPD